MAKYRDIVNRVVSLDKVKGKKITMKLTRLLNKEWNETMFEFGAYVLSWRLYLTRTGGQTGTVYCISGALTIAAWLEQKGCR